MRRAIAFALLALAIAGPLPAMPDAAQGYAEGARAALGRGDGIAAQADLAKALDAGAGRHDVAAAMGEALLIQGNNRAARAWLEAGQFAKSNAAYGWRMLGLLERRSGNFAAAGAAYDKALATTPRDPQLWVDIGRLRYLGGEHLQAIAASDQALAVGPDNVRALEFRAELLRDAQGWATALPLYARAVDLAPKDLGLLGGYAATLGEAGRLHDMLAVTRRMLAIDPKQPAAWYLQAVLAARAGKIELARAMLNRIGAKVESSPSGQLLAATLELEAGNARLAIGLLEPLDRAQAGNHRVQLLLAKAYLAAGEPAALFARFDAAVRRDDAPTYLLTIFARAHEERGDRLAAAGYLDRAAASRALPIAGIVPNSQQGNSFGAWSAQPASSDAAVAYARVLLSTGNVAGADDVAQRFLELRPGSVDALGLAGDLSLVGERPDQAIERYLQSAKVRFPDHLLLRIDDAYARVGRAWQGQALTSGYLAAYPGSLLAARLAGDYSANSGDWGPARALLESLQTRGVRRDARLLVDLSFVQLRSADGAAARLTAERAWRLAPQDPATALAWGLALAHGGHDRSRARQLLDLARDLGGDNPQLAAARNKLGQT